MAKGKYYSVSVGPGDPEQMTLKSVRVLNECPVIAAPETKSGQTMALDIVTEVVEIESKLIEKVQFTMSRDPEVLSKSREKVADVIAKHLDEGRDVALVNIGDVSIFSTAFYIGDILKTRGYETEMVSGVTSFCASAAELNMSLVEGDNRLTIVSAGDNVDEALELPGTKIIMKSGKQLEEIIEKINDRNLKASMVCNCGLENQRVYSSLSDYEKDEAAGYFAVIIVK